MERKRGKERERKVREEWVERKVRERWVGWLKCLSNTFNKPVHERIVVQAVGGLVSIKS